MARRRFLFNGDVKRGLPHWQFKVWSDGELLGEKIVRRGDESVVVPLASKDVDLIQRLFDETGSCQFLRTPQKPRHVDLLIEDDALGCCLLDGFWEDDRWRSVRDIVSKLIDEDGLQPS